jgi:tRNA G18 (ribose-2'-O)-methylase SpoU
VSRAPPTLVGDGIENPHNARALADAAALFGAGCAFRDRARLAESWAAAFPGEPLSLIADGALAGFAPLVALDNVPGAVDVYGFRPTGPRPAVVVGNERRGVARDVLALAAHRVQIPLASRRLNTLNVAAAAAVALYYLRRGGGAGPATSADPARRRPELLLVGASDHVELGSAIRSAGAFGWGRVLIEDRAGVWFGAERALRTEGLAAARSHRNPIRLVPAASERRHAFEEACVVTTCGDGVPLHRANLARGARQLVVLPDEGAVEVAREDWSRLALTVRFVGMELPGGRAARRYRLTATIALAEVARQVGRRARVAGLRPRPSGPVYDAALELAAREAGETVFLDELEEY